MSQFHINKNGVPSLCKAKQGKCPFGGETKHFNSLEDAQEYLEKTSSDEYGLLPEMKKNKISKEWKEKFLKHQNFNDFVREHAKEIIEEKLFEGNDLQKQSLETWKDLHSESSLNSTKQIPIEEATQAIRENVSSSALHGWFREYDSDYKPSIEQSIITNPAVRNAALNVAYENYKNSTKEEIEFNDFLEKEVALYRGGNFNFVKNDVFVSYSFDKSIAEKFTSKENPEIKTIKIKIKDTLGCLQTTGEAEVLVRRKNVEI